MTDVNDKLSEAMSFATLWASEMKIPLTKADFMMIKNRYLPTELKRYKQEIGCEDAYHRFAAIFALREFCEDFQMEKKYVLRCEVC